MTIGESKVGKWDPKLLDIVSSVACRALPMLVKLVSGNGLPLPASKMIAIKDTSIGMEDGYVRVSTGFSLNLT